jgi:hypothetical protein
MFKNIVIVVLVGLALLVWFKPDVSLSKYSEADVKRYGVECGNWIGDEYGNGQPARVSDVWNKGENLVFEVLVPKESSTSSSVFLCVVDPAKGSMIKPSAFDNSWNR